LGKLLAATLRMLAGGGSGFTDDESEARTHRTASVVTVRILGARASRAPGFRGFQELSIVAVFGKIGPTREGRT
jgi:hypothetical protein